jgi:serine/threonine-protein kinase
MTTPADTIALPSRYVPVRHVADGGMASVWAARDRVLGRMVAIKLLSSALAADPGAVTRFEREARAAAGLAGHPNVVLIYDIGTNGERPFIVMELMTGGTVACAIAAARDSAGRGHPAGTVSTERALAWLHQAASGLDAAHARGIVHRDIKPGNLLLGRGGERLAVADFGIARVADETSVTIAGQVLGSAGYLAPEQARGGPITAATDRYALAVVAYELLTGARPFPAATARYHAAQPPPASARNGALPPRVDSVLARGLALDPAARWTSASALVSALGDSLAESAGARGEPATAPAGAAQRRRRTSARPGGAAPGGAPERHRGSDHGATRALLALEAAARASRAPTRVTTSRGARLTPRPHEPRTDAAPPGSSARRRARGRESLAPATSPLRRPRRPSRTQLGSTLALLVLAGAVVLALVPGGSPSAGRSVVASGVAGAATARPAPSAPAHPRAKRSAAGDPVALNAAGYRLMQQGRYGDAIPLLRQAVAAYPPGSAQLTFGYALFNLAHALRLTGDPAAAIPLLQRRLQIPDQIPTVQRELELARAQLAGQSAPSSAQGFTGHAKPGKGPKPKHGHGGEGD